MSRADPLAAEIAAPHRWLSIVGIGEDGVEGLSRVARSLLSRAEIVFGGKRHLALAAPLIRGASRPWPSPFDSAVAEVLALRGRHICVLASGDRHRHREIGACGKPRRQLPCLRRPAKNQNALHEDASHVAC